MATQFTHLQKRIAELELLADEVLDLASKAASGQPVSASLATKGEEWYRGARSILVANEFSGLADFDWCYRSYMVLEGKPQLMTWDIGYFIHQSPMYYGSMSMKASLPFFDQTMTKARALLKSCVSEVKSRAVPMWTELSFVVAADEFSTAERLLQNSTEETIVRASGVIARVALERHLLTVARAKGIPLKDKPVASDVVNALERNSVVTSIQKANLEALFRVGNNCAHPKEAVKIEDVKDLIKRGREITEAIQ